MRSKASELHNFNYHNYSLIKKTDLKHTNTLRQLAGGKGFALLLCLQLLATGWTPGRNGVIARVQLCFSVGLPGGGGCWKKKENTRRVALFREARFVSSQLAKRLRAVVTFQIPLLLMQEKKRTVFFFIVVELWKCEEVSGVGGGGWWGT